MLQRTPAKFEAFRPHMQKHFLDNYEHFRAILSSYSDKENQSVASPIWRFQCRYTPGKLGDELEDLKKILDTERGSTEGSAAEIEVDPPAAKKQRTS
mmetsp:Transcript_40590/g.61313  ORF Transcript_40590/g.61313 Transcript_40590/m.61313 type:complete len:97 (+) Transcript_40590:103-393(+)